MDANETQQGKIRLSGAATLFDVPQEAGAALSAVVAGGVEAIGRITLPEFRDLVPADAKIDKDWPGICDGLAERCEQFRLQSEELARQVAAKAKDTLARKRRLEQSSGAILESDLLTTTMSAMDSEPLAEAKRKRRIVEILSDLRTAEDDLKKATRSSVIGRGGRVESARLMLEKVYSSSVSALQRFVSEQCQAIAAAHVRADIEGQLHEISQCAAWLQGEAQQEHRSDRRFQLEQDPAWSGQGAGGHRASMSPRGEVLEKALGRISPYAGPGGMELPAFWRAFGAWCSHRDAVACGGGPESFARRLAAFIHEVSSQLLGKATLGQVYASAGESPPIDELKTACKPPFPLADSEEVRAAHTNAIRIVQVPEEIREDTMARLGSRWMPRSSDDPNLLVAVQCYDGISARSIILNGNPDWDEAATPEVLERHAVSPKSHQAVAREEFLRRLSGDDSCAAED